MLTLIREGNPLSAPTRQLEFLRLQCRARPFSRALAESGIASLRADRVQVLQANVGKLCNQTCRHCHVDAGPDRREVMTRDTMAACLDALERGGIPVLDVTGGAPEMNPHFRWLVTEARRLGRRVIDRSNLTILLAPGFDDLPEFLAEQNVEIVASLPCYLAENTNAQRGDGVFERSIAALRRLNELGYGRPNSGLVLNLVFNPVGPTLPPPADALEEAYHCELQARYGIVFNRLYTITNMPISRFLADLLTAGKLDQYMQRLVDAFNPATVEGLMCRTTLSVGWDGRLYDCDFNQMLELGLERDLPQTIFDLDIERLSLRRIVTGQHCYGCTAGAGSSCQGAIVSTSSP
jgi:radical SAM/Cys-rich protein